MTAVVPALLLAGGLGLIVYAATGSRVRFVERLEPYAERVRRQLGTVMPARPSAPRTVWGPMVSALSDSLANAVGAGVTDKSLRQAGMFDTTVDEARRRQLASAAAGVGVAMFVAVVILRASALSAIALTLFGGAFGVLRWRASIARQIRLRAERLEAEAHMACQLIAIYERTGATPRAAIERLSERSTGEITQDLRRVAATIRDGRPAPEALDALADLCPDPATQRLYRTLGASWNHGGDPTALMFLAEDLRAGHRQAVARLMARRRTAMVVPLVLFLGPILLIFILAPLPSLIFNR